MQYRKYCSPAEQYELQLRRSANDRVIHEWVLRLDATGLAALLRSVDLATNEGQAARSIGLRRKKPKRLKV